MSLIGVCVRLCERSGAGRGGWASRRGRQEVVRERGSRTRRPRPQHRLTITHLHLQYQTHYTGNNSTDTLGFVRGPPLRLPCRAARPNAQSGRRHPTTSTTRARARRDPTPSRVHTQVTAYSSAHLHSRARARLPSLLFLLPPSAPTAIAADATAAAAPSRCATPHTSSPGQPKSIKLRPGSLFFLQSSWADPNLQRAQCLFPTRSFFPCGDSGR